MSVNRMVSKTRHFCEIESKLANGFDVDSAHASCCLILYFLLLIWLIRSQNRKTKLGLLFLSTGNTISIHYSLFSQMNRLSRYTSLNNSNENSTTDFSFRLFVVSRCNEKIIVQLYLRIRTNKQASLLKSKAFLNLFIPRLMVFLFLFPVKSLII